MRGKDFMVQVSHHGEPVPESMRSYCFDEQGEHRWCIYAYIYPKHPKFSEFKGSDMWQEAAGSLPLHCGCSFLQYHRNDTGGVTSVQVGCDYNHLGDDHYTRLATREDARSVFRDAEDLFELLSNMAARALPQGAPHDQD